MTAGALWLVGAGNMGGAMLRGWIASKIDRPILVIDPYAATVPEGITLLRELPDGTEQPDILVLAIKPQQLGDIRPLFAARPGAPRLLLSILAGVETATLQRDFGANVTVRAMPNLPVSIGEGVTALYSSGADGAAARAEAASLVAPLGLVEWIDEEALFDAVTALSGCGPGFVFRFIEAMAEAGQALGLPADQALRLATATVKGSGLLAAASDEKPSILADRVASPGGSTREGLDILDRGDKLKSLLRETLAASARRNAELAAAARSS